MWLKENAKQQMNDAIYIYILFKTGEKYLITKTLLFTSSKTKKFFITIIRSIYLFSFSLQWNFYEEHKESNILIFFSVTYFMAYL